MFDIEFEVSNSPTSMSFAYFFGLAQTMGIPNGCIGGEKHIVEMNHVGNRFFVRAFYGRAEVSPRIRDFIQGCTLNAPANNGTFGDTDVCIGKHLTLFHSRDRGFIDRIDFALAGENGSIDIKSVNGRLLILKAYYGSKDVTDSIRASVRDGKYLTTSASNHLFGDPNYGHYKHLVIFFVDANNAIVEAIGKTLHTHNAFEGSNLVVDTQIYYLREDNDKIQTEVAAMQEQQRREATQLNQLKAKQQMEAATRQKLLKEEELKRKEIEMKAKEEMEKAANLPQAMLFRMCNETAALPLVGRNVGYYGVTSAGKSSIINSCMGTAVCATGRGEITREITPYRHAALDITYWDIPGSNDRVSYMRTNMIALLKSLTIVVVVVTNTSNEMSKFIELLDHLNKPYLVLVNKIDQVDAQDLSQFKNVIHAEMQQAGNKMCQGVFFVSATKRSGDWLDFVNTLTL